MQRVPPTEKRGRVHTSTVTSAVLDTTAKEKVSMQPQDMIVEWFSGTGKGGQHRNRHANSCRLRHVPTGLVTTSQTRSRVNSYANALEALETLLEQQHALAINTQGNGIRRQQIGSGQRGDKIRTLRFQDDQVVDHRTGKTLSARDFMTGKMYELWS